MGGIIGLIFAIFTVVAGIYVAKKLKVI